MRVDAAKFVKSCSDCQKNKQSPSKPLGFMSAKNYMKPWVEISADIQGPFPASRNQFKYLFVAQDHFTKFVVLKPLRTANGKIIWQAIREKILSIFGYPETIIIDNRTEMDNKITRTKCEEFGIKLTTVPPYHPQSNPTERSNKSLKTLIRTFLKQDHRDWDEHVDEFAFAINNAVHESTKFSPFFLNYGRHPRSPNCEFDYSSPSSKLAHSDPEFWADRVRRLEAYHDLILRHLSSASHSQAKSYNKGRIDHNFKVGDLVLRKDHKLSSALKKESAKLFSPYSGPYKIKDQISRNVFDLDLPPDKSRQITKTHVRFLKPFFEANPVHCISDPSTASAFGNMDQDPPIPRGCWNCHGSHDHRTCTKPKTKYCFGCGMPSYDKSDCPRRTCRERWQRENPARAQPVNRGSPPEVPAPQATATMAPTETARSSASANPKTPDPAPTLFKTPLPQREVEMNLRTALEAFWATQVCDLAQNHVVYLEIPEIKIRIEPREKIPRPTQDTPSLVPNETAPEVPETPSVPGQSIQDDVVNVDESGAKENKDGSEDDDKILDDEQWDPYSLFD